jgi:hypothetical protein
VENLLTFHSWPSLLGRADEAIQKCIGGLGRLTDLLSCVVE